MSSQTEDNFIGARRHVEFVIARLIGCGRAHSIAAEFDCGGLSERQIVYMAVWFHVSTWFATVASSPGSAGGVNVYHLKAKTR